MRNAGEIHEDVWEVLHQDLERGLEIRIVSWNHREPVLEKRYVLRNKSTGEEKTGRCKGFDFADLKMLVDRFKEIEGVFVRGEKLGRKKI